MSKMSYKINFKKDDIYLPENGRCDGYHRVEDEHRFLWTDEDGKVIKIRAVDKDDVMALVVRW